MIKKILIGLYLAYSIITDTVVLSGAIYLLLKGLS